MPQRTAMNTHDERMRCVAKVRHALIAQAACRKDNPDTWIGDEQYAVATAACLWAQTHGLHLVTVADVDRVEVLAVGHVDYADKLALYVSELVYGIREPQP